MKVLRVRGLMLALVVSLALNLALSLRLPAQALEDHWGRKLNWPNPPQRILSLSPATTEMLYALQAQAQVVGVTHDCNYPAAARHKPQVGRFGQIQVEKILKLKPDLILVTADMGQVLEPLRNLPVPVLALKTPDVSSIQANFVTLGKVTGHAAQAQEVVHQMERELKAIPTLKKHPSVAYLVWEEPLMVATPNSFIGNVLSLAGGQNVVQPQQAPFIHYSLESLLKANPDVLVLPKSLSGHLNLTRAPFDQLQAVQHQHLLYIEDDLINRPGPRVLQALQKINHYLRTLP